MQFITDILVEKLSEMKNGGYTLDYSESEKETILKYLKKFEASYFTSEPVVDVFSNTIVADADNGYTDGKYTWYKSEVYYFEKYNLKLNNDFIEYVKKAS